MRGASEPARHVSSGIDRLPVTQAGDPDVLTAAAGWAARFGVPAKVFRASVTSVETAPVELVVVRWLGSARHIEQRTAPAATRSRTLNEPFAPSAFDPWVCKQEELRQQTLRLVRCPECAGEKKVTCPACRGRASVRCSSCNGSGRAVGSRGRMINCRSCRGQGQTRCPCRDGLVTCSTCAGKGRCQHWLEVVEEPICRESSSGDTRLREGRSPPVSVTTEELDPAALPAHVAELLRHPRFSQHWSALDRIDRIVVDHYRGLIHTLRFELAGSEGRVSVFGWTSAVDDRADPGVLVRWGRLRAAAGASGLLLGLGLVTAHALRGPFYAGSYQTLALGLLALALALAGVRLFAASSTAGLRRRSGPYRAGEFTVVLLVAIMVLLSRQPALAHAESLLRTGQREAAAVEFEALLRHPESRTQAASSLDRMLLEDLRGRPSEIWRALAETRFRTGRGARRAREVAEQATVAVVESQVTAGEFEAARSSLAQLEPSVPTGLRTRLGGFVDSAEAASLWTIIRDGESALPARLGACNEIERLAAVEFSTSPEREPVAEREITRACDETRHEEEARVERERREAERRERLARLAAEREERAKEAAQRAWARAPLLCNDGTLSPTCRCGRSSNRGCCSWHGGVSGCSKEYPPN